MMTQDGNVPLWVEFLMDASGDVAHGHRSAWINVGGGVFPWLPDVEESGLVFAEKSLGFCGGDFVFEHEISLVGRGFAETAQGK